MDNKHRKSFALKQSKRRKFMTRMHQNTFGGHSDPRPPSHNVAPTSKRRVRGEGRPREGREEEGAYF